MKSFLSAFCAFCLLLASAQAAIPEAGTYSGMLIMTRQVLGAPVKFNVRAMAQVADDGTLKIVLLTTPSPLPNSPDEIALQTKIQANGACEIPRVPSPVVTPAPSSDPGTIVLQPVLQSPVYLGLVQTASGMFTLSYNDVPAYYLLPDGTKFQPEHFIAPIPRAVYKFSFRKVTR